MADNRLEMTFHQCLGKGGFGEVYLATVRRPGGLAAKMAVKVLKEGLDNEDEAVKRLRDEGRMLTILAHPAILRVHDMCRVANRIALVMEYVEGIDLSRCCRPDRLLPARALAAIMGEVASALHVAFSTPSPETGRQLQLVHRDIKPENIRLTVHGQVKLLDFGIARSSEIKRDAQTRMGDLPFTPGYAAPESFRLGEQGPESDIYALGCTLYRLLAAERFWEKEDLSEQFGIASRVKEYEPFLAERMKKIASQPPEMVALVRDMLAWEKTKRPTAKQLQERCEDLADKLPGPTLQKWVRAFEFPPPKDVKDASLTGRTLKEDPAGGTDTSEARAPDGPGRTAAGRPPPMMSLPGTRPGSMPSSPGVRTDTPPRATTPQRSATTPTRNRSLPGEPTPPKTRSLGEQPSPIRGRTPAPPPQRAATPTPAASRKATPPPPPPGVRTATPVPAQATSRFQATPAPPDLTKAISPAASRPPDDDAPTSSRKVGLAIAVVVMGAGAVFLLLAVALVVAAWGLS
jgi:serine/threonine protein kinase